MMDSLLCEYPEIMTRAEVAELLRVSTKTLCRWSVDGEGPRCTYLTPSTPRYMKGDLETYLKGL